MTMNEYAKIRGLRAAHISQKIGITRQALEQYGKVYMPTVKSLEKVANAMTELGAPTTVVDLVVALYENKRKEN